MSCNATQKTWTSKLAMMLLSLVTVSCGVALEQASSDVNAIRGKEVFRLEAGKVLLGSQIPAFPVLQPVLTPAGDAGVAVNTNAEILDIQIIPVANTEKAQIDIITKFKADHAFNEVVRGFGQLGTGKTTGEGRKSILIDAKGITASPARFDGQVIVTPDELPNNAGSSGGGFLANVANTISTGGKNIAISRFTDEQENTRKLVYDGVGQAVSKELNTKVDPIVQRFNQYYQDFFYKPFYTSFKFPAYLSYQTTNESVVVIGSSEKYSPAERSTLNQNDLSFQIHQDFLNAFLRRNIKTFRPMSLDDVAELIESMPLDSLKFSETRAKIDEKVKDASLNFGYGNPITVTIQDGNTITFTVRASFKAKANVLELDSPPLEANISYQIVLGLGGKLTLQRQTFDVKQIDANAPIDNGYIGFAKIGLGLVFKETVDIPKIPVKKATGETFELAPSHMSTQGGWLNMAWKAI